MKLPRRWWSVVEQNDIYVVDLTYVQIYKYFLLNSFKDITNIFSNPIEINLILAKCSMMLLKVYINWWFVIEFISHIDWFFTSWVNNFVILCILFQIRATFRYLNKCHCSKFKPTRIFLFLNPQTYDARVGQMFYSEQLIY